MEEYDGHLTVLATPEEQQAESQIRAEVRRTAMDADRAHAHAQSEQRPDMGDQE